MKQETTHGIVLRYTPFKDRQKILTIFSKTLGVLSLLLKQSSHTTCLSEPFCEAEWILSKRQGDLFYLQDVTLVNLHFPLRQKLSYLQTASSMTSILLQSQLPEKPAPHLYELYRAFLQQIPQFACQKTLLGSFYLKLLRHEGVYKAPTPQATEEEKHLFSLLVNALRFQDLQDKLLPHDLFTSIEQMTWHALCESSSYNTKFS